MKNDKLHQEEAPVVSKSQKKRELIALQKLGEKLTTLNKDQIEQFPISNRLRDAILEAKRLTQHEAKRRQMQFIGRLMPEEENIEAIEAAWNKIASVGIAATKNLHEIEQWRANLLSNGKEALTKFIDQYHPEDIQHLRHLVQQAQAEAASGKPAGAGRALFRYIRECCEQANENN